MTPRDFCFWLQGFLDITEDTTLELNAKQVQCIQRHLTMVFRDEIDPSMADPEPIHIMCANGNDFTIPVGP